MNLARAGNALAGVNSSLLDSVDRRDTLGSVERSVRVPVGRILMNPYFFDPRCYSSRVVLRRHPIRQKGISSRAISCCRAWTSAVRPSGKNSPVSWPTSGCLPNRSLWNDLVRIRVLRCRTIMESMDSDDFTREQCQRLHETMGRLLQYFQRLERHLEDLQFDRTEKFFRFVFDAQNLMHSLSVETHYMSCDSGVCRPPRKVGSVGKEAEFILNAIRGVGLTVHELIDPSAEH